MKGWSGRVFIHSSLNKSWLNVVEEKGKRGLLMLPNQAPYPTDAITAFYPSNQSPSEVNSHTWYLNSRERKWKRIENVYPWSLSCTQPPCDSRTFPGLQSLVSSIPGVVWKGGRKPTSRSWGPCHSVSYHQYHQEPLRQKDAKALT